MRPAALTMAQARRHLSVAERAGALTLRDDWRALCGRPSPSDPAVADGSPDALPLAGFAAALKANICRRGWVTDCGSAILDGYRSPFSATAVARLESAGAHFAAGAAMDEFGMGSSCEFARGGPVANPWNPERTPGGSSGGSAAAVAAGLVWYALGSDTGGSVRLPAHCCGLVGFKPTWGRVSRYGLVPFASSLDTIGVVARGVADAALVLQHMAGHDRLDATSRTEPVEDLTAACNRKPHPLRVGVPRRLLERDHSPGLWEDFQATLARLGELGHSVEDVDLPGAEQGVAVYQILSSAEAASNLARYDGSLYGVRRRGASYQETVRATRTEGFGPEVKRRILWGTHVLSEGYRDRLYLRARDLRRRLAADLREVLDRVDLLALPTAPVAAFPLGSLVDDPVAMHDMDAYTVVASLAGLPAVTLPTGLDPQGLPLSLQLVGPPLGEGVLTAVAAALEKELRFRERGEAPWNRG